MALDYANPHTPTARTDRRFWAIFSCCVLLVAMFAIFVWPTRWKYDHVGNTMIRIDRVTGRVDAFRSTSWVTFYPDPPGYPE